MINIKTGEIIIENLSYILNNNTQRKKFEDLRYNMQNK